MQTKYFNDGLIGNEKIKASFTKNGELLRLYYGTSDYKQFLDCFHVGVKVNDSAIIYLHEDINNLYSQEYIENTNVLKTEIYNSYFKIRITQTDLVPINENVLIKKYVVKNENEIDLNVNLLAYSKLFTNLNNDTSGYIKNNTLIQYNHDYSVCMFSKEKFLSSQVNGACNNFWTGAIGGKDYIGMSPDSAISYNLNKIAPGNEKELILFIYINKNEEKDIIIKLDEEIERIRNLDVNLLMNETIEYWQKFVNEQDILNINPKDINPQIKNIYNRSILLFHLLTNKETGGISAGIEIDEHKTKCGRYSYCWPRDAGFITEALDVVGMHETSRKFYSNFCKMTQNKNGMWEQRFYTDGHLAPSWGYQIDETASIIFGAYNHYDCVKDRKFLEENIEMFEKAIKFLQKYTDDLLEEKHEMPKSYDLWEEFEGYSLYSISSIYAAFKSMIKIYNEIMYIYENDFSRKEYIIQEQEKLERYSLHIKQYCEKTFYDEYKKSYVRNIKDRRIDISLIGTILPFNMFLPKDEKVKNTIEKINETIQTYTGGILRYEGDTYVGGKNPWPIATLWMAWYYLEIGDIQSALEKFEYVTKSATTHGFIGEQVDDETLKPCWVIGLTWSHAMYVITLEKLIKLGIY